MRLCNYMSFMRGHYEALQSCKLHARLPRCPTITQASPKATTMPCSRAYFTRDCREALRPHVISQRQVTTTFFCFFYFLFCFFLIVIFLFFKLLLFFSFNSFFFLLYQFTGGKSLAVAVRPASEFDPTVAGFRLRSDRTPPDRQRVAAGSRSANSGRASKNDGGKWAEVVWS